MTHIHKGQLTKSPQWAKHLKDWKQVFWSAERKAAQAVIEQEVRGEEPTPGAQRAKRRRPFEIERRYRVARLGNWSEWRICGRYETEAKRERALASMKDRNDSIFQYQYRTL